jgi:phenylalanyl-tRNA synthetase alpha chain
VLRRVVRPPATPSPRSPRYFLPIWFVSSFLSFLIHPKFYVDPAESLTPPETYYSRVSKVHSEGGFGSVGYRAPWSHVESRKLLLRTHTTASSAAMLFELAAKCRGKEADENEHAKFAHEAKLGGNDDGFKAAKLFSIDRVFRNETMDATHLAEFHQVEGVVADRGLTLADLIGEYCYMWRS